MALDRLQPIGEAGAYWRAAVIAATIANTTRDEKRPKFTVADFLPSEPVDEQTDTEQDALVSAKVDSLFEGMGG